MGLLLIIVLLAVGYLMYKNGLIPASLDGADRKVPIDIINERYARGEIDREEYERLRRDLN
tara:strand:- start:2708 stop:2890 length:183 start_codon:yes stop_codon:yes gene_type:complete